jgi:hypothetical protein
MSEDWREEALAWVGRKVRIVDGPSTEHGAQEIGVVLCVDATDYRPSAWVKVGGVEYAGRPSYPAYRSCDLCWLEDLETEEGGPVWCTSPNSVGHAELDGRPIAERVRSLAALAQKDTN